MDYVETNTLALIGRVMMQPSLIFNVPEVLPEHLMGIEGEAWRAMRTLAERGVPINVLSVDAELGGKYNGQLTQLFNRAVSSVPHVGTIEQHAQAILEDAERKRTRVIGERLVAAAMNRTADIEAAKSNAAGELMSSIQVRDVTSADNVADSDLAQIQTWSASPLQPGQVRGIPTRLTDLDNLLNGLWQGFYIIAARPSTGKTALAVRLAPNLAYSTPVLYLTFEQSAASIWRRIVCANSGIAYRAARNGLSHLDLQNYQRVSNDLRRLPLHFYDGTASCGRDMAVVSAAINRFGQQHSVQRCVIFLDNLGHITAADNVYQELGIVTKGMLQLSNRLNATIIGLHQLSRGVESRSDKHPILSDLRDSGYIEENADAVFMLYRDDMYNPNTNTPNILELAVVKNRLDGALGRVELFRNNRTGDINNACTTRN